MIPVGFLVDPSGVVVNSCDPDPEMIVTVSTTNGSEPNVTFCGKTWSHSPTGGQVSFGTPQIICPTFYYKGQYDKAVTYYYIYARHNWQFNAFLNTGLYIARQYWINYFGGFYYGNPNWKNQMYIGPGAYPTNAVYRNFFGTNVTVRPVVPFLPGYAFPSNSAGLQPVLAGVWNLGPASYNDYVMGSEFFGSYTLGTVTYTWSQGVGW